MPLGRMHRTAARLEGLPLTIFAEMSALAARTGSVNLGQGFPDTDGPPSAVEHAVDALRAGRNQYPPGIGTPELRAAIARHQDRYYDIEVDPDTQVVVTTGCTEGIAASLLAFVDPGAGVAVLEPYFDSYRAMITYTGGVRRPIPLRAPSFRPDPAAVEQACAGARVLLLNSPHNPTGTVLTREELEVVADAAIRHDLVVITDEVYEHLTFDGREHVPIAGLPGMFERTVTLSSVGKSFSFTGWKVGWATGPADLVGAVMAAKQWLTYSSGAPLQPAVAHALDEETAFPRTLAAELQASRDLLAGGLAEVGLKAWPSEGTYFATTDVSHLGWEDGLAFCLALPERARVVAIPTQVLYDDAEAGRHLVRWAFCKSRASLEEGIRRLRAAHLTAG